MIIKKYLRKIKFVHILLIILIIVIFLGLFKKEVGSFITDNFPSIQYKGVTVYKQCKVKVNNPAWAKAVDDKCSSFAGAASAYMRCEETISEPQTIEETSTCSVIQDEKWFWAFGKYWFKIQ